ncbi:hypothetical protein COBT_001680 [Conglomerata obtusa]
MTITDQKSSHHFITKTPIIHTIYAPIQHWQLRDMIKAHKNGIIYCDNTNVNIYNTKMQTSNVEIASIPFQPTCIAHLNGITALGGNKGQVLLKSRSIFKGQTGHTINNAVTLFQTSGGYKLLIANNDTTIRLFDVETLSLLQTINHRSAINNMEVSPDGKMMISVGDTPCVNGYFYDSGSFQKYSTFTTVGDAGFKTSWNSLSTMFAVSTQDCYACVFDIRRNEKLIALKSKQFKTPKGAVRVVEFSKKKNLDLLMFSEHVSYINLVDCRNFELRQSICTSKQDSDRNISGAIFSDTGDSIVVAFDDAAHEYLLLSNMRRVFSEATQT